MGAYYISQNFQVVRKEASLRCEPCEEQPTPTSSRPWNSSSVGTPQQSLSNADLQHSLRSLTAKQVQRSTRGPTMEEAIELNETVGRELARLTPRDVLQRLQAGGARSLEPLAPSC